MTSKKALTSGLSAILMILSIGSILVTCTTLKQALAVVFAVSVCLICTTVIVALLGKFLPKQAMLFIAVIVMMGFASIESLLIEAYASDVPDLSGVYVATILITFVSLADARILGESFTDKVVLNIFISIGFMVVVTAVCAFFKEFIASGTILGKTIIDNADMKNNTANIAFGVFFGLAIVVAIAKAYLDNHKVKIEDKEEVKEETK